MQKAVRQYDHQYAAFSKIQFFATCNVFLSKTSTNKSFKGSNPSIKNANPSFSYPIDIPSFLTVSDGLKKIRYFLSKNRAREAFSNRCYAGYVVDEYAAAGVHGNAGHGNWKCFGNLKCSNTMVADRQMIVCRDEHYLPQVLVEPVLDTSIAIIMNDRVPGYAPYTRMISSATARRETQRSMACFSR